MQHICYNAMNTGPRNAIMNLQSVIPPVSQSVRPSVSCCCRCCCRSLLVIETKASSTKKNGSGVMKSFRSD